MSISTATRSESSWDRRSGIPAGEDAPSLKDSVIRAIDHILGPTAMLGPIAFLAATLVLESVNPGYDRVRDTISSLVWGQYGWTEAVVFFLFGASVLALVFRLGRIDGRLSKGKVSLKIARLLLAAISAGFLVIAFCPTYHPLAGSMTAASIHEFTVRAMALLFPLECAFTAAALPHRPLWMVLREYTWISAAAGVVLVIPAAVAVMTNAPWLGAIERVLLANGLIWTEAMAVSTFRLQQETYTHGASESGAIPGMVAVEASTVENNVSGRRR
jgi:hypothetical protein